MWFDARSSKVSEEISESKLTVCGGGTWSLQSKAKLVGSKKAVYSTPSEFTVG